MTMKPSQFASPLLIAGGLALAVGGLASLNNETSPLRHSRNPFAIQGSAYGKLLARLSETTIDRVWHLGVEQIVPHYMSGIDHGQHGHDEHGNCLSGIGHEQHGHDDHDDHDDHEPAATASPAKGASLKPAVAGTTGTASPQSKPLLQQGKRWFQDRVIAQHHRTNPYSLTDRHLATVYRDIEKMLLRSFKLDPTHYGAYDSYHLFLTTHDFGGTPEANEQAVRVANAAIAAAFQENEDPEPWLTAAAAGMNLYLMDAAPYMQKGETIPLGILKEYRDKIGYCLTRFEEIQAQSEKVGNWERLSTERQMEIAERSLFAKRTFKQFDAMIARAESPTAPATPESDVAKREEPLQP
jgi:hypothetical protein